jgi:hypothetical protein
LTFDGSLTQSGRYTFDEASGSCRTNQSIAHFDLLLAGWLKPNLARRQRAAAREALQNLRVAIAALPAGAFNTSFFAPPRPNQNGSWERSTKP